MVKTTLQNRLIMLMVVFSIIFISVFTAIQLSNQMNYITRFNIYRSKMGAFITKNSLEMNFSKLDPAEGMSVDKAFEAAIKPLSDSEVVEKAALFSKDGNIAVSLAGYGQGSLSFQDKRLLEKISSGDQKDKWFFSEIDKRAREVNIFIRFLKDDAYLAKLTYQLGNIQDALNQVYGPIVTTVIVVIAANVIFAVLLSHAMIFPIKALNTVTKEVAAGDLELKVRIKTGDELQELGETFNYMTVELKKMKERAENANPLTKLPGNIVIMEEVEKRLKNNEEFTVIYSDLNNFKAFNDKYGIHQGDEAIKMTAAVMREAVKESGGENDLLGHEGGDDFVIVTTPEKGDAVANAIINKFDAGVKKLYHAEDLDKGFFMAKDRDGNVKKFPIMGIALAGVTNQHRPLTSYGEVTNICAEVKKKAKAQGGVSAWYLDKRNV